MNGRLLVRVLAGLVVTLLVVAVLFFGVFPTRLWLDQRDDIASARSRIDDLQAQIGDMEARADALRDPAQIEQLARDEFLLVHPGDESFVIQPPPREKPDFPAVWPFPGFERLVNGDGG
jgi:cell division protein FtsB